ncbi:hypothetical protein NDU88_003189 [Pleurodeles waltl]|uniref:Uncharacterized protein n=1 Tax=Pleurodeles waltl TaxID=8319 RepID=A0AAV7NHE0_PLEWA|nr:hypothetical protein NDU88_003189 [Pleurodeles waltl]
MRWRAFQALAARNEKERLLAQQQYVHGICTWARSVLNVLPGTDGNITNHGLTALDVYANLALGLTMVLIIGYPLPKLDAFSSVAH